MKDEENEENEEQEETDYKHMRVHQQNVLDHNYLKRLEINIEHSTMSEQGLACLFYINQSSNSQLQIPKTSHDLLELPAK